MIGGSRLTQSPAVSRRAFVMTGVLAALVGGCGGGDGAERPQARERPGETVDRATGARPGPSDADAVRALLARRAAALGRGDAAASAATAVGAQRRRDRAAARRARRLQPRKVVLGIGRLDLVGRRAELRVRSSHRLRGVAGRFAADRRIVAVRTRAGWRVRAETSRRERHPWELGRFEASRTPHFLVHAPAGVPTRAGGLAVALEAGRARLRSLLPSRRLRRRTLVVVARDARQALALTGTIRGVGGLAAMSDAEVREGGPARRVVAVNSQRLIVVWPRWAALDPAARLRVVTHELAHTALAGATSGRTPAWLIEGLALFVSGDRRTAVASRLARGDTAGFSASQASAAQRALSLAALSEPDAIARLRGTGQVAAYAYSSAAAFRIAERYGTSRLLALYDAFNDEGIRGAPGPGVTDRTVRRVLGISLRRLEDELRGALGAG
jgi:hypothetical protein